MAGVPAADTSWVSPTSFGIKLFVLATPNAKKSEVVGVQDGALKIKLQAQPIEGKANDALVRFLAGQLGLPRKAIELTRGAASRNKTVEIHGLTLDDALRLLAPAAAG
ncbi:MAG TPA: DUF167 domain-containing protein [Burkholderiaceae bacterium]